MHPRAIDIGPDGPAAPVDPLGEGVKGIGDIEGREHPHLIEKAMRPSAILVQPDDLAAPVDPGGLGANGASERDIEGREGKMSGVGYGA